MYPKVKNCVSSRGNPVPNQFIIETAKGTFFQSYSSTIAYKMANGEVRLDKTYWSYSSSTGKYRNDFLGEGIAETRAKIKSGEYSLWDLN